MSYRSHADLGGQDVRDPIIQEPEGEYFHAAWEPRVMAMVVAMGPTGMSNIDLNRSVRETLPNYRDLTYYEIWFAALEKLAVRHGIPSDRPPPPKLVLHADDVMPRIMRGFPASRPSTQAARFAIGDRVRTVTVQPDHHTRLPAYARGKTGVIEHVHGAHVFPDTHARGLGESPQWLYTVSFEARELWGDAALEPNCAVSVDAFEPYLEIA